MKLSRRCGILAHPTSFPSPYGIGDMGPGAYAFVDFARKSGAALWQILPLNPTGFGDSPYQCFSTFAGNPLLISPEMLLADGLLTGMDIKDLPAFDPERVDYGAVIPYKDRLFRKAFMSFRLRQPGAAAARFAAFCADNALWLEDYAFFAAAKAHFIESRRHGGKTAEYEAYRATHEFNMTESMIDDNYFGAAWNSWPLEARGRTGLSPLKAMLQGEIQYHKFLQYVFFNQWAALKAYANAASVDIIGDLPIFVAMDSADVWADPGLFHLDKHGAPVEVAGVPPDYFSPTGQLWGNPLYDWDAHKNTGYAWWLRRVEHALRMADILRIDHFRGFDAYWAVPWGEKTAENGVWREGPGARFFESLAAALAERGALPVIAEDLGVITDSVETLRDSFGLPGMKVLQFAFGGGADHVFLPHNYANPNTVAYTGTHDNDTTLGWYEKTDDVSKDLFRRYMNVSGEDAAWDLIRLALSSTAAFAVAPIQDIMRLGTECRMNLPGTSSGNWRFRYTPDMLSGGLAESLMYLNKLFNRLPPEKTPSKGLLKI